MTFTAKKLGQNLREARERLRLTQAQLDALMGWQSNVVAHYEIGDRVPGALVLRTLAQSLNTTADKLLGLGK